ncbi:retrovirus-related pol polyprotein from transposon TNT 1-94 [Tanacetum coccineum]
MGGNLVTPCNVGGLKYMDALIDQGSDVNVMPLFHLQWANQQKAPDYIYPVDFIILDVKEDKKKPFILGTPFLTTAKAEIRFDKGTITLKSGKNKINFFKIPESPCRVEEETENDIDLIASLIQLYLMRRSPRVPKSFMWTIIG